MPLPPPQRPPARRSPSAENYEVGPRFFNGTLRKRGCCGWWPESALHKPFERPLLSGDSLLSPCIAPGLLKQALHRGSSARMTHTCAVASSLFANSRKKISPVEINSHILEARSFSVEAHGRTELEIPHLARDHFIQMVIGFSNCFVSDPNTMLRPAGKGPNLQGQPFPGIW